MTEGRWGPEISLKKKKKRAVAMWTDEGEDSIPLVSAVYSKKG